MPNEQKFSQGGFTVIELLIVMFIVATVITGLFGFFLLSLRTTQESERRIVAVALANEKAEMVRNLPYVDVGTAGGVPSGSIPQQETVTRNGLGYEVKTDIRYVDDFYDGSVGGSVEEEEKITICHKPGTPSEKTLEVPASALNAHVAHGDTIGGCNGGSGTPSGDAYNADFKQVRIEVSWNSPNDIRPVLMITYVVPQGIEGGELGGTLDFQALNAGGEGIEGAQVHIVNDELNPAIDITTETNSEGHLVLPGMPQAADSYEISVTLPGYTQEQTYDGTASFIPDTDHSHLTIVQQEVTEKTFFIDHVGSFLFTTKDEIGDVIPSIAYHLQGIKTIGVDGSNSPVYVADIDATTQANGQNAHADMVWDSYILSIDGVATGYDIKETSELMPFTLDPAEDLDITLTLVPHTPLSLHVTVASPTGLPIDNATVQAVGSGYDQTLGTGLGGQVFFADVPSAGDYTVTIDAPGYEQSIQTVPVDGSERVRIDLTPES